MASWWKRALNNELPPKDFTGQVTLTPVKDLIGEPGDITYVDVSTGEVHRMSLKDLIKESEADALAEACSIESLLE